jgi:hypothetical protein
MTSDLGPGHTQKAARAQVPRSSMQHPLRLPWAGAVQEQGKPRQTDKLPCARAQILGGDKHEHHVVMKSVEEKRAGDVGELQRPPL